MMDILEIAQREEEVSRWTKEKFDLTGLTGVCKYVPRMLTHIPITLMRDPSNGASAMSNTSVTPWLPSQQVELQTGWTPLQRVHIAPGGHRYIYLDGIIWV